MECARAFCFLPDRKMAMACCGFPVLREKENNASARRLPAEREGNYGFCHTWRSGMTRLSMDSWGWKSAIGIRTPSLIGAWSSCWRAWLGLHMNEAPRPGPLPKTERETQRNPPRQSPAERERIDGKSSWKILERSRMRCLRRERDIIPKYL